VPFLSQINLVHTFPYPTPFRYIPVHSCLFKWIPSLRFPDQNPVCMCLIPLTYHIIGHQKYTFSLFSKFLFAFRCFTPWLRLFMTKRMTGEERSDGMITARCTKYRIPYSWEIRYVLISDLTHLLTSATDGNKWSESHTDRFTPRKGFPVPTGLEAEWVPEPVWMLSVRGHLYPSQESTHALILELCLLITLRESNTPACPFPVCVSSCTHSRFSELTSTFFLLSTPLVHIHH